MRLSVRKKTEERRRREEKRERELPHLKHADSAVDSCVERAVQLHGEGVGAVGGVVADPLDDSLQLLHVVHHHLYSILHRVQRGLGTDTGRNTYTTSPFFPFPSLHM